MNEDFKNIEIKPIRNHQFAHWFQEVNIMAKHSPMRNAKILLP